MCHFEDDGGNLLCVITKTLDNQTTNHHTRTLLQRVRIHQSKLRRDLNVVEKLTMSVRRVYRRLVFNFVWWVYVRRVLSDLRSLSTTIHNTKCVS